MKRREELATLVAAQILEEVGQFARAQSLQAFVRGLEAHLRRRLGLAGRFGEGLDRRPVDDAVRRGTRAPPARSETAQERGVRHVRTHQADATDDLGQVQIGGPDDLDALHVDELVVQHVLGQEHLARATHHVAQVEPARAQQHLGVVDPVDRRGGNEGVTAPHLDDESTDGRVDLPVRPAGHDVFESADLLAPLVAHRSAEKAGQRHDGIEDALRREDAPGPPAPLMRTTPGDAGTAVEDAGAGRCARRWRRCHGAPSCVTPTMGQVGSDDRRARGAHRVQQPAPASVRVPVEGFTASLWRESADARSGARADRATGGFASRHGHTSFSSTRAGLVDPCFAAHSLSGHRGATPVPEPVSPPSPAGYRRGHGPRLPARSRGVPAEIAGWLRDNLPEGWGERGLRHVPRRAQGFNEEWTDKLFAGGWICASWPTEYGGKGLSLLQQVVFNEEFARVGAPLRGDFFGDTLVGPTILQWGTEEQKQQFIPGILKGEIAWCQGFSEPDAGSDLASLKTRAELDGDEWVINGQKVWTTQAQYADYIFLLARTDPDVPKHAGISYLLVPMKQPGVEVRPIEQIDGSAEFNEVFFTNVRCPKDNVVGGVNNGWKVAMTTLGFERGTSATTGHRRFQKEFDQILEVARQKGRTGDPLIRQRLASRGPTSKSCRSTGSGR